MTQSETMVMKIMTPARVVWEGEVVEVASKNSEGPFSILPEHAQFITIIADEPILVSLPDGSTHSYTYQEAVLLVENNEITIFVHTDTGAVVA